MTQAGPGMDFFQSSSANATQAAPRRATGATNSSTFTCTVPTASRDPTTASASSIVRMSSRWSLNASRTLSNRVRRRFRRRRLDIAPGVEGAVISSILGASFPSMGSWQSSLVESRPPVKSRLDFSLRRNCRIQAGSRHAATPMRANPVQRRGMPRRWLDPLIAIDESSRFGFFIV